MSTDTYIICIDSSYSSSQCNTIGCHLTRWRGLSHLKISIHELWRLPTNFPLSYNLLPCLSLTRSRRAWMEEWLCPSHCLICLGKALTSNTNLNNSSGNLGSVSEARLGLAQWPSLREHGKFAGSICHRQHELRKRTRVIKWVGSTAGFSICREKCSSGCTMRLSEAASKWNSLIANACNFAKRGPKEEKKSYYINHSKNISILDSKGKVQFTAYEYMIRQQDSIRLSV